MRDIIQHKTVTAQKPRIILITTPPINEYKLEEHYLAKGVSDRSRTAEHTKKYADACKDIGKELDVAVLDIWSIMMAKAGWKEGELLVGSKKVERSKVLDELLVDGKSIAQGGQLSCMLIEGPRPAFSASGIQSLVRVYDGVDLQDVA